MKTVIIFTVSFVFCCVSSAQNLVPNWSFEQYDTCPAPPINFVVSDWFNPSVFPSTPDYFNACSGWVPNNPYGYQQANSGVAYVGIGGWAPNNNGICGEFISCELTDSLIMGNEYFVSFYVSLIESAGFAISNIGLYFSDTVITNLPSGACFPFVPQIENPSTNFLSDTLNWMQISGIYSAQGGEKFIIIGNLRTPQNTNYLYIDTMQQQWPFAYYYIDDVTVIDADSVQGINEQSNFNFNIYPNPATDFLSIKTKTNKPLTFTIFDLLGREKVSAIIRGDAKIDVGSLASGVYVYRVYDGDKVLKVGKLMKE